jgi:hypothetical protein
VSGRKRATQVSPTGAAVIGFTIADGRIVEIDLVADPDKLHGLSGA